MNNFFDIEKLRIFPVVSTLLLSLSIFWIGSKGILNDIFFERHALQVGLPSSHKRNFLDAYKLFFTGWLHADFLHLALNLIAFIQVFYILASKAGVLLTLTIFLLGLVVPNLIRWLVPVGPAFLCGASGGISALLAAGLVLTPKTSIYIFPMWVRPLESAVGYWLLFEVLLLLWRRTSGKISHFSHVFGAIVGVALLFALVRYSPSAVPSAPKWFKKVSSKNLIEVSANFNR